MKVIVIGTGIMGTGIVAVADRRGYRLARGCGSRGALQLRLTLCRGGPETELLYVFDNQREPRGRRRGLRVRTLAKWILQRADPGGA
jgi:hypothetical protein